MDRGLKQQFEVRNALMMDLFKHADFTTDYTLYDCVCDK